MNDLLPIGASALERALDAGDAARLSTIDPRAIADAWNPWRCPVALLGQLAWASSIDLWNDDWPELKKRQACAAAVELHRLKGTLAGIRAHLALVDARLVRARRPRDRSFLAAPRTDAERAADLAALPQLRVYPFVTRTVVHHRSFWRAPGRRAARATLDSSGWDFSSTAPSIDADAGFVDLPAPRPFGRRVLGDRDVLRASRGAQLVGIRTTIVDAGVERPAAREDLADGFRVIARSSPRRCWLGRDHLGTAFLERSTAASECYVVRLDPAAPAFSVQPGTAAIAVRPTRIHARRTAPASRAFLGTRRGRFLATSHGPWLVYDQVPLHTPATLAKRQRRRTWCGATRLGAAPFTAELLVEVPMRRQRLRAARWNGVGFLAAADMTPVADALEAVRVAKAARDTVLVDTALHRAVRLGDGLRIGSFALGEIRKAA